MNPMTFILTIVMIWVVLLFMSFSIGVTMPEKVEKGHADSAPEKHYMFYKFFITLGLSIVLAAIYWYVVY